MAGPQPVSKNVWSTELQVAPHSREAIVARVALIQLDVALWEAWSAQMHAWSEMFDLCLAKNDPATALFCLCQLAALPPPLDLLIHFGTQALWI